MKPQLPDGLVAIVKRECATCVMVDPLFANIAASGTPLTVYTQDDPTFPASVSAIHDADLSVSWHYDIETVPTLLRIENGEEADRTFGWSKDAWQKFTGITDLGADLPVMRPGCGSLSVDPNLEDELRVRFTSSTLHSRHVELASAEDEFESMFTRGWTDGLPVIPPTPERVLRMLTGTTRSPQDIVAIAPPNLVELTIEKIAINAVMAGALPEYLPWIITALEAVCNDEFNMHGVLATTMPVGPVIICNGPGTKAIGMNSGVNVFGQGNRANLTIGRAVQLTIRNVGGGKPGEVDRATHGNPGKLSFCFAEDEAGSPFGTLAQERGIAPQQNAVTVFAGEGPRCVVDQAARTPEQLTNSFAACLRATHHPKSVLSYDAILVVSPDHSRVYAEAGWDREKILSELYARLNIPGTELVKGALDMAEGLPAKFADRIVPKFKPGGILLAHAGGGAGLFSSIIGGWVNGAMGSTPVTRPVLS
ncbi:MAG: thioredoxin family protein [Ilumatobacteraceae bacterium]|nr:thioredoxin family protein [Ilumatobacteraceae bacterium]